MAQTAIARPTPVSDADAYWRARPGLAAPRAAPGAGRGLFALADIAAGTLIDVAFSVPITPEQCRILDDIHPIGDFPFEHPEDKSAALMLFGLISLCNHAETPNAELAWRNGGAIGWLAELVACADIPAGVEITYRYKCPLWFPARG